MVWGVERRSRVCGHSACTFVDCAGRGKFLIFKSSLLIKMVFPKTYLRKSMQVRSIWVSSFVYHSIICLIGIFLKRHKLCKSQDTLALDLLRRF